jgi:hypothetical protein
MSHRNPTAALLAIIMLACLVDATQAVADRLNRNMRQDVSGNHSHGPLFISARRHRSPGHRTTVQVYYRSGTRFLSVTCLSAHCLVVLSSTA